MKRNEFSAGFGFGGIKSWPKGSPNFRKQAIFREATGHTILERYGTTKTIMKSSNLIEESGRKAKNVGYRLSGEGVIDFC